MTLTATAEPETAAPPPPPVAERPVFAATTPARPRALKVAGRVTAGLVALWLVALVLGTFGFGPVAGIGLPRIGGSGDGNSKPQREAAHRTQPQPSERVTESGVTLTTHQRGHGATRAKGRGGNATGSNRPATTRRSPSSHPGGNRGSQPSHTPGTSGGGSGASAQTPAAASTPASPATSSTTTTNANANQTHSHATPPRSSSTAPGSRSNASTAPGRDNSASSPTPGSGRTEHAPPKG
jgi:hypothetical protein